MMLSADDARLETFKTLDRDLKDVYEKITDAIADGKLYINTYDLTEYQVQRLKALSYKITHEYCDMYKIAW